MESGNSTKEKKGLNKPFATHLNEFNGGRPRCMSTEMVEKSERMREDGYSYRRIALVIGVSHNTIRRYLGCKE
jgi:hypothetical protein